MSKYKFPASLPRKMYWSNEIGGHATCPDCGAPLESEHHTYMMATRQDGDINCFMVGKAAGHFCGRCPLVVLDRDEFEEFAAVAAGTHVGVAYVVMGMVDFDAIPAHKRNLPFDDDTNPVPLMSFTNIGGAKPPMKSKTMGSRKAKAKKRKRKR